MKHYLLPIFLLSMFLSTAANASDREWLLTADKSSEGARKCDPYLDDHFVAPDYGNTGLFYMAEMYDERGRLNNELIFSDLNKGIECHDLIFNKGFGDRACSITTLQEVNPTKVAYHRNMDLKTVQCDNNGGGSDCTPDENDPKNYVQELHVDFSNGGTLKFSSRSSDAGLPVKYWACEYKFKPPVGPRECHFNGPLANCK